MNENVLKVKQSLIEEVKKDASEATTVVLFEYRGLSVSMMTELRRNLLKTESKIGVYKNTLTKRAFEDLGQKEFAEQLKGPNAILFCKDVSSGLKVLGKFARRNEEVQIKAGLVEGNFCSKEKIKEIEKIPGREGLLSMLLSVLNAPVRQFALTVKAVAESK